MAIAVEHPVQNERVRSALPIDLFHLLAEGQCFGLVVWAKTFAMSMS